MKLKLTKIALAAALLAVPATAHQADNKKPAAGAEVFPVSAGAPARKQGEGAGPFRKMVIRNATIIDGTGAPPRGRFDIVVEGNKISSIK